MRWLLYGKQNISARRDTLRARDPYSMFVDIKSIAIVFDKIGRFSKRWLNLNFEKKYFY